MRNRNIVPGTKGVGLHLMNYRARMAGGSLEVQRVRDRWNYGYLPVPRRVRNKMKMMAE